MPDYSLGKIYKLQCNITGLVYVGSTVEPTLARRKARHESDYKAYMNQQNKYVSSFEIIKNRNYGIILIENYPCNTKDELRARERYWIDNPECVNVNLPNRSKKEYNQDNNEVVK